MENIKKLTFALNKKTLEYAIMFETHHGKQYKMDFNNTVMISIVQNLRKLIDEKERQESRTENYLPGEIFY